MYLVIDTETSGKTTYRRFCNPLDFTHHVDLLGYKYQGDQYEYSRGDETCRPKFPDLSDVSVIVGQNLKFDLLWYWGDPTLQAWLKNGGKLWDTLTVQYLLDAQEKKPRNLDALALMYGGTVKDSNMKEYYKNGGQSKDIPLETLLAYNKEDITNTNLVLQGQLKIAQKEGMLPIISVYMDHYLASIEMEYNGLHVNKNGLSRKVEELKKEDERKLKELIDFAAGKGYEDFNPLSLDHLSLFLFGGVKKLREKRPQKDELGNVILIKKTGQPKEKYEIILIEARGLLEPSRYKFLRTNKKGNYFLTNDDLDLLKEYISDKDIKQFIEDLLYYRKLTKKIGTYYEGLLECHSPYTGCVHPEFRTALTDTGRLSSTNPNAQNLLPEVLDYVDSRFGEDGTIIELDFSQLEIRLQAYITQCFEMQHDIMDGIDFHILRLSYAEELSYEETYEKVHNSHEWTLKRKAAKAISFQKAYGAAPKKIAEATGLSEQTIMNVFSKEDLRYPEINEFYEEIIKQLKDNRIILEKPHQFIDKNTQKTFTIPGEQAAYSVYKSITGKKYIFYENAVLTKRGQVFRYFSMPKVQNSPVQGIAADFVSCQVGRFYRALKKSALKCYMIDEVHDSIILDCDNSVLTNVIKNAKMILENVEEFEKIAGLKFNTPMQIDIKYNKTWGEIKKND